MDSLRLRVKGFKRSWCPFLPQIHFFLDHTPPFHRLLLHPKAKVDRLGKQKRHSIGPNIIIHLCELQLHATTRQVEFGGLIGGERDCDVLSEIRPKRSVSQIPSVDVDFLDGDEG